MSRLVWRLRAAWSVLCGRPTMYRCKVPGGEASAQVVVECSFTDGGLCRMGAMSGGAIGFSAATTS